MMESDVVMKLDFDPKEIDHLLDFLLEECPDIILNVLRHQACKPSKKKPKKKPILGHLDQASRCASVEVLTRNAFHNAPKTTSRTTFHIPPFNTFHRIPSNINVSISFEKKCLFDHQLRNRSLENLSKCTCVLNTPHDHKKPSKVHFGQPLVQNCKQASNNRINEVDEKAQDQPQAMTKIKEAFLSGDIADDNVRNIERDEAHQQPTPHNNLTSQSTHTQHPQQHQQLHLNTDSLPSTTQATPPNSQRQATIVRQKDTFEEATSLIESLEAPKVASCSLTQPLQVSGVARTHKTPTCVLVNPCKSDVLNFSYSLKNDKGSYEVELVESADVHYVCVAPTKATTSWETTKAAEWLAHTAVVPASVEKIELGCVDTKPGVNHSHPSSADHTHHVKKDKSRSSKKSSHSDLKVCPMEERRSSRSSGRCTRGEGDRKVEKGSERVSMHEQSSATSSVGMWRELEEELKRLNEMVEEDPREERRQCRREARKHSGVSVTSRASKSDAPPCRRRGTSTYVGRKPSKHETGNIAYIDSGSDTLSLQSSVKTGNYFSEEEEVRRRRKMEKQSPLSNDGSFLLHKAPYARSHSAKVMQLSGAHDSLERKMRSQKYLGNAISEVSDKETKKRWKKRDSDGDSTASLFCGGGLDLLKELTKMEVLKRTPLRGKGNKRREGKRGEAVYDSESCSSRMSRDSSTIRSIDTALDQYLNEQSGNKEYDYGKFMLCTGKDLAKEKAASGFQWYKKNASKSEAIEYLRSKPVGSFLIRDSNSFPGAYGLVLKIETPSDPAHNITETQSIRNFLIESTKDGGVRVKGSPLEPVFPDLQSLVNKHSQKRLSLPCKLILPAAMEPSTQEVDKRRNFSVSSNPGLSCSVLYLSSENVEALAENTAILRATQCLMERVASRRQATTTTVCDLHISREGLVLTDTCRTLFFRRHYGLESVTFAAIHEDDAKWTWTDQWHKKVQSRIFGILSRSTEKHYNNVCHLFAELDFPASEIVEKISQLRESMEF